jgi:predicted GIY-YIG superfamily endonuclease
VSQSSFTYVYILEGTGDPDRHYVGFTEDLRARVRQHNAGQSVHTSKQEGWRLKTYIGFSDRNAALAFECYLKSGSGRAFAKKRL